jgi:hypothetical protein
MNRRKMTERVITITIQGAYNSDLEQGMDEVVRLIREGYTSGMDSNSSGNYRFEMSENLLN